jgi:putative component of membrane protein insertase Oxa1/YidC/SpoIIIJ protein YidD
VGVHSITLEVQVGILSNAAVSAIDWYQVSLSPKKGFRCAHRALHGGHSCSAAVKNNFLEQGCVAGILSVIPQARKCYAAAVILSEQEKNESNSKSDDDAAFCAQYAALEGAWWCCFLPFIS